MPRGYRYVILAAFGWIILASGPAPNHNSQAKQSKSGPNIAQTQPAVTNAQADPVEQGKAGEYQRPCEPGQDNRASDLCAQWEAAVAARDSANWAFWSFLLSIFGVCGLIVSLCYTNASVKLTLLALKDGNKSRRIAEASLHNQITANQQQLRAYVGIKSIEIQSDITNFHITAKMILHNYGQTPAVIVSRAEMGWIGKFPIHDPHVIGPNPQPNFVLSPINPGASAHVFIGCTADSSFFGNENAAFYIYGVLKYKDCFNEEHILKYAYRVVGSTHDHSEGMQPCTVGNFST